MTTLLLDPPALERASGEVERVGSELELLARAVAGLSEGATPLAAWLAGEGGRVAGGLRGEADCLRAVAADLRRRAREAREAGADDGHHRGLRQAWPRRPALTAPAAPVAGTWSPDDVAEELVSVLRAGLAGGPGGFGLALDSSAGGGARTGAGTQALGAALLLLGVAAAAATAARGGLQEGAIGDRGADPSPRRSPSCSPTPYPEPDPLAGYRSQLTPATLGAARRELRGEVVRLKPNGAPYNHVLKVEQAQAGLKERINTMRRTLANSNCDAAQKAAAQRIISALSRYLDYTEQYVPSGAGSKQ